jgi:protein-L-isoaspartate O-methyltransferase
MADMPSIRRRMADRIARRGIRDARVLEALRTIPREAFVDPGDQSLAYEDRPLLIGEIRFVPLVPGQPRALNV